MLPHSLETIRGGEVLGVRGPRGEPRRREHAQRRAVAEAGRAAGGAPRVALAPQGHGSMAGSTAFEFCVNTFIQ